MTTIVGGIFQRSLRRTWTPYEENSMSRDAKHMMDEADIGSGEKKPADRETEKEISKIPKKQDDKAGRASDEVKREEKQRGLVDEDHPFPSKGN